LAEKQSKGFYLHNRLKHVNVNNDHDFSALFVVNTPITDNSGIAHCVEHLIFRASKAFPHAITLFQLTALTNVKINASTMADTTYFHCQSPCLESFNLALSYLLNGIFSPKFCQDDLKKEIHDGNNCGVIYRELIGIKSQAEQQDKQLINENSSQVDNSYNYSGDSQLIGQLSLSDLQKFHQQHYQASNITLVTANADIEQVSILISQLPTQQKSLQIKNHLANANDNTNKRSHSNIHQNSKKKVSSSANDKQQKKYSPEINELIAVYYQWLQNPFDQEIKKLKKQNKVPFKQTYEFKQPIKSTLILPLILLSKTLMSIKAKQLLPKKKSSKQVLPHLFTSLCLEAKVKLASLNFNQEQSNKNQLGKDLVYVHDKYNTLLLIIIDKTERKLIEITSYIINAYPSFLAPRCQGLCYAIQSLPIEESSYLAIYSAFDCATDKRLNSINQSLLQLSQDISFIKECLPLAKIKYCCTVQAKKYNNDISPLAISAYLLAIAKKTPI